MTNETTNQAGWIAYDVAYKNNGGGSNGDRAGMAARWGVLRGPLVEGPAEHPASFSARSTARAFGTGEG